MCFYSAGRVRHTSTYLVGWDSHLLVKVGITMNSRWQGFCTRGATLYHVHRGGNMPGVGWVRLESELETRLDGHLTRAFSSKEDAAPFLGGKGAGWSEVYRATSPDAYSDALASCARIMREHPAGHCGSTLPAQMHGRTDARTYEDPHSSCAYISPSVPRTRVGGNQ